MNIREISKQEIESTLINLQRIFKETDGEAMRLLNAQIPSLSQMADTLLTNGFRFLSAFENGEEVGTLAFKDSHVCVLAVQKRSRNHGVGTQLLANAAAAMAPGTRMSVNADRQAALFYQRNGFEYDDGAHPVVREPDGLCYIPMHRML